jgi:adenylate kinase
MKVNIHILGIQGSGKGTQSSLLVERFNLAYISSGNLFRERAAIADPLGEEIARELKRGVLLSNTYLCQTVEDFLANKIIQHPYLPETSILGDGVIRTKEQYGLLLPIWEKYLLEKPLLIHLNLSEEIAYQRIQNRRLEQNDPNKRDFHLVYSGKLLQRDDDNPKAIEERFRLFHELTLPVLSIFREQDRCIEIDANQSVETIQQEIREKLNEYYPQFFPL